MKSLNLVLVYAGSVFSAYPKIREHQPKNIDLTKPSCTPTDAAEQAANWNRCPLGQDNNVWYGLTNEAMDYYDAAKLCDSFGAELVTANDATVDMCAAYAIDVNEAFDQLVLYSGRYLDGVLSWVWCSGDKCNSSFDYVNWDNSSSSEGNCMGGYLQDYDSVRGTDGISGYGWVQRDCKQVLVRAMCRLDCGSEEPVTTEQVTTVETTTGVGKTQYLMYTMWYSQTVYSYTLDVGRNPVKNGQFTIPFSTQFPGLAFNVQLNSLEIIGDFYSSSNKNHQMMTTAGSFSDASGSLFHGDKYFEVCYSRNAGTLVFSGYGNSGGSQVYIITLNSNWNQVESSDKSSVPFKIYLSSFQNPSPGSDFYEFGVVEQDDKIYLIGGLSESIGYQNKIQILNLQNSESLRESQTRQWSFITSLQNYVFRPAVVYSNDKLLVVAVTGYSSTSRDVQYLSLASNTTGVYAGTIDCGDSSYGLSYPGMYNIAGGNVSIFGGYRALDSCIQQTSLSTDLDSKWDCLSSSESALEGLGYSGDGSSYDIRYSNFVV